jgi:hypothetical protein
VKDVLFAARDLQQLMLAERWSFCFIGGLALIRWGEPRLTRDVDVSLFSGFGNEEVIVAGLLSHYSPRLSPCATGPFC